MWVKAIGAVLGLALGVGAVGAEDRAEALRDLGARVADLATGWGPDLQAAIQGFSAEDLGFAKGWQAEPVDPWRIHVASYLPRARDAEFVVIAVVCVRMGAATLEFYAENVDVTIYPP